MQLPVALRVEEALDDDEVVLLQALGNVLDEVIRLHVGQSQKAGVNTTQAPSHMHNTGAVFFIFYFMSVDINYWCTLPTGVELTSCPGISNIKWRWGWGGGDLTYSDSQSKIC